jgi:hypothetical protein
MSNSELPVKPPKIILLPHQERFLEAVLAPESGRLTLLEGEVGIGKGTALVALATRLLGSFPEARVLFIVPAGLKPQVVARFEYAGVTVLPVDRFRFRELLERNEGPEIWPRGAVVLISTELARKPDICESLASVPWNLTILDEGHLLTGDLGAELLRQVEQRSEKVVVATVPGTELQAAFSWKDPTILKWKRDEVVDSSGKPLDQVARPIWHQINFMLKQDELDLFAAVNELNSVLDGGNLLTLYRKNSLLRSFDSSPAALESFLRRLRSDRNEVAHGIEPTLDPLDDELETNQIRTLIGHEELGIVGDLTNRALDLIERAELESKFMEFRNLVWEDDWTKPASSRLCVFTGFRSTLFYLAAGIEDLGIPVHAIQGSMSHEQRQDTLQTFLERGGILVATVAVLSEDVPLGEVTDLVLYDLSQSELGLRQVVGRFDRFGRKSSLHVYTFNAENLPKKIETGIPVSQS